MDHKKILGRVIRQYRKRADNMTQPQLSEITGIDQGAISRIENGKQSMTDDQMVAIATALGRHVSELWQSVEGMSEGVAEDRAAYNTAMPHVRMVPLIGWVQAGRWTESPEPIGRGHYEEFVPTQARIGKRAYALEVKGDSMTNPRGWPTFPPGVRIVVDPDKAAQPNSLVIAQIDGETEATFKRLVQDGGRSYLVPLNPQYPTLPIDRSITICGVVVAMPENSLGES